jgi:hypothetical protein
MRWRPHSLDIGRGQNRHFMSSFALLLLRRTCVADGGATPYGEERARRLPLPGLFPSPWAETLDAAPPPPLPHSLSLPPPCSCTGAMLPLLPPLPWREGEGGRLQTDPTMPVRRRGRPLRMRKRGHWRRRLFTGRVSTADLHGSGAHKPRPEHTPGRPPPLLEPEIQARRPPQRAGDLDGKHPCRSDRPAPPVSFAAVAPCTPATAARYQGCLPPPAPFLTFSLLDTTNL